MVAFALFIPVFMMVIGTVSMGINHHNHNMMVEERRKAQQELERQHKAALEDFKRNVAKLKGMYDEQRVQFQEMRKRENALQMKRDAQVLEIQSKIKELLDSNEIEKRKQAKMLRFLSGMAIAILGGMLLTLSVS